mmetsp:Transcript_17509/g.31433  ORF Transcript_17509/g.31433 Transcript_17509/m.31433 type:complete len:297 (-) Transcript_17509:920-1810(-)
MSEESRLLRPPVVFAAALLPELSVLRVVPLLLVAAPIPSLPVPLPLPCLLRLGLLRLCAGAIVELVAAAGAAVAAFLFAPELCVPEPEPDFVFVLVCLCVFLCSFVLLLLLLLLAILEDDAAEPEEEETDVCAAVAVVEAAVAESELAALCLPWLWLCTISLFALATAAAFVFPDDFRSVSFAEGGWGGIWSFMYPRSRAAKSSSVSATSRAARTSSSASRPLCAVCSASMICSKGSFSRWFSFWIMIAIATRNTILGPSCKKMSHTLLTTSSGKLHEKTVMNQRLAYMLEWIPMR